MPTTRSLPSDPLPSESASRHFLVAIALGTCAALLAVPIPALQLTVVLTILLIPLLWWCISGVHRWLVLFFLTALLTPPLPISLGDSGPHLAILCAGIGVFTGVVHLTRWRALQGWLPFALVAFVLILLESVAFAALYSGPVIAAASFARVILFVIGVYIFFYTLAGPGSGASDSFRFTRFLYWLAVVAALFACLDFYFQFPAPAGYGPQFVWLDEGVFRRAQGFFYEASTLGNFCAFFLTMILVALFRTQAQRPFRLWELFAGGVILATALIFSYSRASVVNVLIAITVLTYLQGVSIARSAIVFSTGIAAGAAIVRFAFPSFSQSYWDRLLLSAHYVSSSPNGILSGRLQSWNTLLDFLAREPWHALFGIGYKTLPYSEFAGRAVVADNTYLSLLVETGLLGLTAFLVLNAAILRGCWRAARSPQPRASFFGSWMLCFWTGQMVQMLSGDLITYWRVLPVYFWTLATAVRESDETDEHFISRSV